MDARALRQTRAAEREQVAETRRRTGRDASWRRRLRHQRRRAIAWLAVRIAPFIVRALARTWRFELEGAEQLAELERTGPVIFVLWHGSMLPACGLHRDRNHAVLVSPSGDGAIAVGALARLGFRTFRGSTSRGGVRALRELAQHLRAGTSVGLTPDGPRGPRHTFNAGAAWLARESGAAIVTVAFAADRAWRLRSWDRFCIPKPRARIAVVYGRPQRIEAGTDDLAIEQRSAELRSQLLADERGAFERLGVPPELDA